LEGLLAKPPKQMHTLPLNLREFKDAKAALFVIEVSNKFTVIEVLKEQKSTGSSVEEHLEKLEDQRLFLCTRQAL